MKSEKLEGGTMWENDTLIPQGIYDGTNLVVVQPGEHYFVADKPEASKTDNAGLCAVAVAYTEGDL